MEFQKRNEITRTLNILAKIRADNMNSTKADQLIRGLTSIARKVYDATPMVTSWSAAQVSSEMRRTGHVVELRLITGCLASLCQIGLLKESPRGSFIRVKVREHCPTEKEPAEVAPPAPEKAPTVAESKPPTPQEQHPLEYLGLIAERMRYLSQNAMSLAAELETVAIHFDEQMKQASADGDKLRQLQALLKSI